MAAERIDELPPMSKAACLQEDEMRPKKDPKKTWPVIATLPAGKKLLCYFGIKFQDNAVPKNKPVFCVDEITVGVH